METEYDAAGSAAGGVDGAPFAALGDLLDKGGPAIWAIIGLSVVALGLILWKLWSLSAAGAWRRERAERALEHWANGADADAAATAQAGEGVCARLVAVAIDAASDPAVSRAEAEAETTRVAKRMLGEARDGLRGLELIATVSPLLGLFGTVLGMIAAFQSLETSGAQADASALAGGIWEALLTTAAGMAVAIPVAAALTWFESVIDRLRRDMEDMAGRVLNRRPVGSAPARAAAE